MLDLSAPKLNTVEHFHRESVLSGSRPGPRGVSSLWLQGSRLPVRSWKDLPARQPFGTAGPGLCPEAKDAGPAPPPPGGVPDPPRAPPFQASSFPPFSYVTLSPSRLPGSPSHLGFQFPPSREGLSCFSPQCLAQWPAQGGPQGKCQTSNQ